MLTNEINLPFQKKLVTKLDYDQLDRYSSSKSCYIELDNLQKGGIAFDSELQDLDCLELEWIFN